MAQPSYNLRKSALICVNLRFINTYLLKYQLIHNRQKRSYPAEKNIG